MNLRRGDTKLIPEATIAQLVLSRAKLINDRKQNETEVDKINAQIREEIRNLLIKLEKKLKVSIEVELKDLWTTHTKVTLEYFLKKSHTTYRFGVYFQKSYNFNLKHGVIEYLKDTEREIRLLKRLFAQTKSSKLFYEKEATATVVDTRKTKYTL